MGYGGSAGCPPYDILRNMVLMKTATGICSCFFGGKEIEN